MIDQIDRELCEWIASVVDTPVVLAPPGESSEGAGITLHLLDLVEQPPPRGSNRAPLQVALRYLVTTFGENAAESHRWLWELILQATRRSQEIDWQVDLKPLPIEFWQACGVAPRPSFVLQLPLRHEWEQPSAPLVTAPMELGAVPKRSIVGTVVGPDDFPLSGAYVELPAIGLSAYTGSKGRFAFASVPSGKHSPKQIMVRTKGRERMFDLSSESGAEPLIIRFSLTEE